MADPTIVVRAAGDFRRLYSDMSQADSRFGKMGSTIKAGLAGAAIAGTAAMVKFGIDSVRSASSAQQSIGATESVFGKYADTVIARSKEASDAVGLSANEYRELANVTGAMLASSGLPLQRVTNLTDKLTKRAADLAATFGGSTKEAIEAVGSLLRGEADPIERYGVSIKQSDVNARLAAKGLDKLQGSAKKQAEQQARVELLFRQTAKSAGQFARESDTLAGAQQRLDAKVENVEASFGKLLLPVLTEVVNVAGDKLVPALEDLQGYLAENQDEIRAFGGSVKDTLLPPLSAAVDLAQEAAQFFGNLPGPVKETGIQAGIAALVLPRLAAGVGAVTARMGLAAAATGTFTARLAQNRAAMTYATGVYGKAAAALHGFGGAARSVAGVGGMVLLAQGMQQTDKSTRTLMSTMGGAALGFSVGGPIGAAVGGLGGLMYGLASGTEHAASVAELSKTTWDNYRTTMDAVTGATTAATKSMVIQDLQQSGLLKKANEVGLSQSTLVDGILGQKGAREELAATIRAEQAAVDALGKKAAAETQKALDGTSKLSDAEIRALGDEYLRRKDNLNAIKAEVGEVQKATRSKREELLLLQSFPDQVITQVQTPGAVDSKRELAELVATYKLTPKQIATVIKMNGIDASTKEVRGLAREIVKSGNVKPSDAWKNFFKSDVGKAKGDARGGAGDINDLLGIVGNKRPNIANGPFGRGVSGDLTALIAVARGKSNTVGYNLGSGMHSGMGTWIGPIASRAREMVLGAIAAANGAAGIASPSREMIKTGGYMGEGLDVGLRRSQPKARTAGQKLMDAVRAGVVKGSTGVEAALDKVTATIEKGITGKKQEARERALMKRYASTYAALRKNAKAQDVNTRRLEAAREKLKDLTAQYRDYSRAIRDSFTATGDITQLGKQDDGSVSIKSLLNDLESRVLGAERFEALMDKLAKDGLSRASIQQMLDAGPEAALATAEAIAAGGAASITQMNQLQTRLAASGTRLGDLMAERYYGAGVDAATGIVKGLEAQSKNLDRAAVRLANSLVAAVKKALGIKSPSREFRLIADHVTDGLTLQLDANSTYVKRSGAVLASSLVKGFDNPKLDATVGGSGSAARDLPVKLDITLTAQAMDKLTQAERLQQTLDYGRSNGVRGTTF